MSTPPATLDAAGIARRIPHAGRMCLLDRLLAWSPQTIVCEATGHTAPDHPLRSASGLLAPAAIEYAAQAMALHGALIHEAQADPGAGPTPGFLASVRGVHLHVPRLDTLTAPLQVQAERLAGEGHHILYRFTVHAGPQPVAEGRAAVVLNTPL
jgi:predicted hotdog family 3-hydroxylacyl-ACP dehydratase